MAYTGQELFERAMAVMDEISETGALNPDDVAEYKAKALCCWIYGAAGWRKRRKKKSKYPAFGRKNRLAT